MLLAIDAGNTNIVFALVQAGDEPSPAHPYYEHDFFVHAIIGIRRRRRALPTRSGAVIVHECANLPVTPRLEWVRVEKRPPPEPADY